MVKFIKIITNFFNFFNSQQLTAEEVLTCVPTDWICTIYGQNSLSKRLELKHQLYERLADSELYYHLKSLDAQGLIELEPRQWQNPIDKNFYVHQQCRKIQTIKPNLPQRNEAASGLLTA